MYIHITYISKLVHLFVCLQYLYIGNNYKTCTSKIGNPCPAVDVQWIDNDDDERNLTQVLHEQMLDNEFSVKLFYLLKVCSTAATALLTRTDQHIVYTPLLFMGFL